MYVSVEEPKTLILIEDIAEGEYFWWEDELHLKPIFTSDFLELIKQDKMGDRVIIVGIDDDCISLMNFGTNVLRETRNICIGMDKVKQG